MHVVSLLNCLGRINLKMANKIHTILHYPFSRKMSLMWNKPEYCLNKLSSVELRQLRTIRVAFSGAGSVQLSLLVLHQIACGGL